MSIEIEFPLEPVSSRHETVPNPVRPVLDLGRQIFPARLELVIVGSVHVVVIGFVILPQAFGDSDFREFQISCENLSARTLLVSRDRVAGALLNCPAESKPNSRITKRKMIGVMLMACSSATKNRSGKKGEQNTNQWTRDGKPEGNAPAGL